MTVPPATAPKTTSTTATDRDPLIESLRRWLSTGGSQESTGSRGPVSDVALNAAVERHLQQMNEAQVSAALRQAFDEHCTKAGPSIDAEKFKQIRPYEGCGSQIPLMGGRS